jgi:hypothetical protein
MDAIPTAWSGAACYDYGEAIMTRHLCIVARDNAPLYGFLTIAFRERPPGADTLDVVLDRRRADALPASGRAPAYTDRRRHARVVEALRTRGYAIVAGPGGMPSPSDEAFIERAVGILADVERRGPLALRFDQRRTMVRALVRIAVGVVIVLAIVWMLATLPRIGGLARISDDVGHWGDAVLGGLERAWTTLGGKAGPSPGREPDGRRSRLIEPATPAVTLPTVPPPTLPPPALTAPAAPEMTERAAPALPPPSARPAPRAESRLTPPISRATEAMPAPLVEASWREPAPRESSEPPVDTSLLAAFNGLPRVELSRQPTGNGIVYTVRLADTGGRPVPGAQVWMRGQSADGLPREARLDPVDPPGTYRSSPLATNTLPPQLSVRVVFSNMRVQVPVEP